MHHALRALGCRLIDDAPGAAPALAFLEDARYHLMICSWALPQLSARALIHFIRAAPRWARLPVAVAGVIDQRVVDEAAQVGVSAFLPRPLRLATLDELLRLFVGRPAPSPGLREHSLH